MVSAGLKVSVGEKIYLHAQDGRENRGFSRAGVCPRIALSNPSQLWFTHIFWPTVGRLSNVETIKKVKVTVDRKTYGTYSTYLSK